MAVQDLTVVQLEQRLDWIERIMQVCDDKSRPYHNQTYQKVIDELARREMEIESCDTK